MNKWPIIIMLTTISCIDFEFEAPYEDLNGIYIELIAARPDIRGETLLFEGQEGYINYGDTLNRYRFGNVDSIYAYGTYVSPHSINGFDIANDFAYVASDFGLEIINFQENEPHLYGSLQIPNGADFAQLRNGYIYMAESNYNNVYVIDITDKMNPEKVSEYIINNPSPIQGIEIDSSFAYVLLWNSDLYVLDISDPMNLNLISHMSLQDTLGDAVMLAVKDNCMYLLKHAFLETYERSDSSDLEFMSRIGFASPSMNFIHVGEEYGLACSGGSWVYLLNLEYPSRPCIAEIYELGLPQDYGIIRDNYIYLLIPYLAILEIKEVQ